MSLEFLQHFDTTDQKNRLARIRGFRRLFDVMAFEHANRSPIYTIRVPLKESYRK